MPSIGRESDTSTHGGTFTAATKKTFVNGQLVLTVHSILHCPEHGDVEIVEGSSNVFKEGMAVAMIGSLCACGARVSTGSPDTFAN